MIQGGQQGQFPNVHHDELVASPVLWGSHYFSLSVSCNHYLIWPGSSCKTSKNIL
jgi:hypothetical protein